LPSSRSEAPSLFDTLLGQLLSLPNVAVYVVIGAMAAVENVFPPVPADTAVAIGALLSYHGSIKASTVFGITWAANVFAATAVYAAGRTLGRHFFTGRLGRRLLHPQRLQRMEDLYRRHGVWGVFVSRFIPGVRAVVPPFAGIARLGVLRAIVPLAIASGIWYGLLTFVIARFARQIEDVVRIVTGLNWIVLALALSAVGVVVWVTRRRRQASGSHHTTAV
jgi:membrane protein DedA with SNARE-associated domain